MNEAVMEEHIDTAEKFTAWCQRVKARRARNKTPEGRARLTSIIVQAREACDDVRSICAVMEEAADGLGRAGWYARKAGHAVDDVESLIDCVEEQLEREIDDGTAGRDAG